MSTQVSFSCPKDPLLAKHYRDEFSAIINHKIAALSEEIAALLVAEANRQAHWDFDLIEGKRIPKRDEDGTALLLVPEVAITVRVPRDRRARASTGG